MDTEQKQRAAAYVLRAMSERGWDPADLVDESGLDPQTIRTFLSGKTWPQTKKRRAIEDALGMPTNTLEMVTRGVGGDYFDAPAGDPVERAINDSALSRANKAKLIGTYYEMLDGQAERQGA